MYLSLTYADVVQFFWMIWSIRAYFVRLNITYLPLGILSLNTFLNRHAVRWRSWLSHLSNTQKVLSSSLGRIIFLTYHGILFIWEKSFWLPPWRSEDGTAGRLGLIILESSFLTLDPLRQQKISLLKIRRFIMPASSPSDYHAVLRETICRNMTLVRTKLSDSQSQRKTWIKIQSALWILITCGASLIAAIRWAA